MQRDTLRWIARNLGMGLVLLIASSASAQAEYTEPGRAGSLLGEAYTFVGDFSQWNGYRSGVPMTFLGIVPSDNRGDGALLLFWFWLHDPIDFPNSGNLPFSQPGSTSGSTSSSPGSSNGGGDTPIGTIAMGQSGNGSSSPFANGDEDNNSSGIGGNSGSTLGLNNSSQNGNGDGDNSSGNGGSSASTLGSNDPPSPPSQNGGGNNGQPSGSDPTSGTPVIHPDPIPAVDPVPEPASFTLLAIGGIALLIGWRMQARKGQGKDVRRLASIS